MLRALVLFSVILAPAAFGQLVAPNAIPKSANPPVIFVNGYQATCPSDFKGTFGNGDAVLAASGIASVFFDNCTVTGAAGKPSIEQLAAGFAAFLAGLQYTDGTSVAQADVVAHSMGGLLVRAYLAGKTTPALPAPSPLLLRKAVFLGTPHFGSFLVPLAMTGVLGSVFGNDAQARELLPGSQFLLDLATWNGGLDDLRGLDAIAVAGNSGNGFLTSIAGFDDGVVSLTSASLGFVRPGRTRVLPACHISDPILTPLCPASSSPGIAIFSSASAPVAQIVTSFLTGTTAWQSIGTAIESVTTTANSGGLLLGFQDANGGALTPASGVVATGSATLSLSAGPAALYRESLPAKVDLPVSAKIGSDSASVTVNLAPAATTAVLSKPGPLIHGVVPAGSAVFPYAVTSGAYVAVYGANLASNPVASALPYPSSLGGVTVTVNNQPAALQFVSAGQINLIFPNLPPGSATLTVTNGAGKSTSTVVVAPAVPSIFSLDGSGSGPAAAINAKSGAVVGSAAPLKAGVDVVAVFLTGLGPTTTQNGLDYAQASVSLNIGGQNCPISYAGRVPGVPGLDQVNCQIPAGLAGPAVPVIITAAGRASNTVTLAIQ
jgi:uncharacterized protein (TIGR03437 family)